MEERCVRPWILLFVSLCWRRVCFVRWLTLRTSSGRFKERERTGMTGKIVKTHLAMNSDSSPKKNRSNYYIISHCTAACWQESDIQHCLRFTYLLGAFPTNTNPNPFQTLSRRAKTRIRYPGHWDTILFVVGVGPELWQRHFSAYC